MAGGIFPATGSPPSQVTNGQALIASQYAAGCEPAYYASRCNPRVDTASINALISEVTNAIVELDPLTPYDCTSLDNLSNAVQAHVAANDSYLSGVSLAGTTLTFTGQNNSFSGSVDISGVNTPNVEDMITNMVLVGTNLIVTGQNGAFSGIVDLSSLVVAQTWPTFAPAVNSVAGGVPNANTPVVNGATAPPFLMNGAFAPGTWIAQGDCDGFSTMVAIRTA